MSCRGALGSGILAVGWVVLSGPGLVHADEDFSYMPPGTLVSGSGTGRADDTIFAPGMRYPVESVPSFMNSQVWGVGGSQGPAGSQCAEANFSYPWWDNYCESRSWNMPLCPSGTGHQGQDIRGATCDKSVYWIVSSSAGTVTHIGTYSLNVTAPDGTRFDYLHGDGLQVGVGTSVEPGQRLARISNEFGGTPTTVHLHFNIRQNVAGVGTVYVPPYASLVDAYQRLIGPVVGPAEGALDEADCSGVRGWTAALDALDQPIEARLYFDGAPGAQTIGHPVLADLPRADLCDAIGSCDHGFDVGLPLSLLDDASHEVWAVGSRGFANTEVELPGSPRSFRCPLVLPHGVRRSISSADVEAAWRFSPFWDVASASAAALSAVPMGDALPAVPVLVREQGSDALFLIDGARRRRVPDARVAAAWDLYPQFAELVVAADLAEMELGPDLPGRPFVVRGPDGEAFLIDAFPDEPPGVGGGGPTGPSAVSAVGAGSGSGGASADAAESADADGCGCRLVGQRAGPVRAGRGSGGELLGGLVAMGLGALVVRVRRRRRG